MRKRLLSCFLSIVLVLVSTIPALAASVNPNAALDEYMATVDHLISSAKIAAQSGDFVTANRLHTELNQLGVEILETYSPDEALYSFGLSEDYSYVSNSVDPPADTTKIHWYKVTMDNYYYPQRSSYFDVITLRAESWDDTSSMYYVEVLEDGESGWEIHNITASHSDDVFCTVNSTSTSSHDYTLNLRQLFEADDIDIADYSLDYLYLQDISLQFSREISYYFTYIRPGNSSSSYSLSCVDSKLSCWLLISGNAFLRYLDETTQWHFLHSKIPITLQKSTYANAYKAIEAFLLNSTIMDGISDCYVYANGNTFPIWIPPLPATPEDLA